ncbi:MAG: hypothetical protein EBU59_01380 [Planctomycetia bacterium]|nr:hypothetical protein [Planctomycetia bacterium]
MSLAAVQIRLMPVKFLLTGGPASPGNTDIARVEQTPVPSDGVLLDSPALLPAVVGPKLLATDGCLSSAAISPPNPRLLCPNTILARTTKTTNSDRSDRQTVWKQYPRWLVARLFTRFALDSSLRGRSQHQYL